MSEGVLGLKRQFRGGVIVEVVYRSSQNKGGTISIGWASVAGSVCTGEITTCVEKREEATGERFHEWYMRVFPMVSKLFGCEGRVSGYEDEYHVWHDGDVVRGKKRHGSGTVRFRREIAAQGRLGMYF